MAINKSLPNQLSFQEIEDEFGQNPGRSLGRYRTTHPDFGNKDLGDLRDLPLDIGIPKSGEIKFSDFYQKDYEKCRKVCRNAKLIVATLDSYAYR